MQKQLNKDLEVAQYSEKKYPWSWTVPRLKSKSPKTKLNQNNLTKNQGFRLTTGRIEHGTFRHPSAKEPPTTRSATPAVGTHPHYLWVWLPIVWTERGLSQKAWAKATDWTQLKVAFLSFRFVWWLDLLLLKEGASAFCSLRWLLEVFDAVAEFVGFRAVAGFHLNDCIEYLLGPLAPPDSYQSFQPERTWIMIFSVNPVINLWY